MVMENRAGTGLLGDEHGSTEQDGKCLGRELGMGLVSSHEEAAGSSAGSAGEALD